MWSGHGRVRRKIIMAKSERVCVCVYIYNRGREGGREEGKEIYEGRIVGYIEILR